MGVQSNGTTLAGMTKKEVHTFFEKTAQSKLNHKAAILTYQNRSWEIQAKDINLQANIDDATEAAYQVGRSSSLPVNLPGVRLAPTTRDQRRASSLRARSQSHE